MRELLPNEIEQVSGGFTINSGELSAGLGAIGLGIAIVATGGLAGAGALAALSLVGGSGVALSALGGALIGDSVDL